MKKYKKQRPISGQGSLQKTTISQSTPAEASPDDVWSILKEPPKPPKSPQEELYEAVAEAIKNEIDREIIKSIKKAATATPALGGFSLQRNKERK